MFLKIRYNWLHVVLSEGSTSKVLYMLLSWQLEVAISDQQGTGSRVSR